MSKVTSNHPKVNSQRNFCHFARLALGDPHFFKSRHIDILLGAEFAAIIKLSGIRHGPPGTPSAEGTKFGWILSGPTISHLSHLHAQTYIASCNSVESNLEITLQKFWEIEQPHFQYSFDDIYCNKCEKQFAETTMRDQEGRYIVSLPFVPNHPPLGNSKFIALRKFKALEARLIKSPSLYAEYIKYFNEALSSGLLESIPLSELNLEPSSCYYMPYTEIHKESSTTTKFRVVYNCSSKTLSGISLNQILEPGPKLQNDLVPLLYHFRSKPVAFSADIVKFYNQFRVCPAHTNYQRLVWRSCQAEPIKDYRLTRVTFGITSAPYLSIRAYNKLIDDESTRSSYKLLMKTDILVDNILTGAKSIPKALDLQTSFIQVLAKGKLELQKWSSNCQELLDTVPLESQESTSSHLITDEQSLLTLGPRWIPTTDRMTVVIPPFHDDRPTKRTVLSSIAKVFDPLGWLSPVTVRGKIFMQTLWKRNLDWDSPIPETLQTAWKLYGHDLRALDQFSIDRCFTPIHFHTSTEQPVVNLIGFSDASNLAYCAVAYIQVFSSSGESKVTLMTSKTKVVPVKGDTIPRLELSGATLLAKLLHSIIESFPSDYFSSIHAFTDSTNLLDWLKSTHKVEVFVHNRVRTILEVIPQAIWHHV